MLHPDLAMALARQHHLDLIKDADRYRVVAGARRRTGARARSGRSLLGQIKPRLRSRTGDSLTTWAGRQPAPRR